MEKITKNNRRYHYFTKCTKNHVHMLYYSWDMAWCNCYFSFRAIFCPFTIYFCPFPLLQPKKSKFQKIEIKPWTYHNFTRVPKIWLDDVRFLRYGAQTIEKILSIHLPKEKPWLANSSVTNSNNAHLFECLVVSELIGNQYIHTSKYNSSRDDEVLKK